MGEQGRGDDDGKDAAFLTKRKFRKLWSEINDESGEHWLIDLRGCANLIGFCFYPVGWNWEEYNPRKYSKTYPWEKRAKKVYCLDNAQNRPILTDALPHGVIARQNRVEQILMRMIKRKEILVTVYDHTTQGFELDDKMRLDAALKLSVEASVVGFNELTNGDAWDCRVDTKSLLTALENTKGWETKAGAFDWLKIERYARELYEKRGTPRTRDDFVKLVIDWHSEQPGNTSKEPTFSTLRALISDLHKEYSGSSFSEI